MARRKIKTCWGDASRCWWKHHPVETPQKVEAALSSRTKQCLDHRGKENNQLLALVISESCIRQPKPSSKAQRQQTWSNRVNSSKLSEFLPKRPDLLLRPWHHHTARCSSPGPAHHRRYSPESAASTHNRVQTERETTEAKRRKRVKRKEKKRKKHWTCDFSNVSLSS